MTPRMSSFSHRGFSLVEILCVIAVLAILAGLLISTLSNSVQKSHAAKCVGNLRQYKIAWDLYANDNNGEFPPDGNGAPNPTWWQAIKSWNPDALPVHHLQCPANPDLNTINQTQEELFQRFTYSYNAHIGAYQIGGEEKQAMNRLQVKSQKDFPLFIDGKMVPEVGRLRYHWSPGNHFDSAGFWHQNQAHLLFLDGHVETFSNTVEGKAALTQLWAKFWNDYAQPWP